MTDFEDIASLTNSLASILGPTNVNLVEQVATPIKMQSPELTANDVVFEAINQLVAQGKLSAQLQQRLNLALEIAKISGNNSALIKAIDADDRVNSVRDFSVHYDTTGLSQATSDSTPPPPTEDQPEAPVVDTTATASSE